VEVASNVIRRTAMDSNMMDRTMRPGRGAARDFKRFLGLNTDHSRHRAKASYYEFHLKLTGAS